MTALRMPHETCDGCGAEMVSYDIRETSDGTPLCGDCARRCGLVDCPGCGRYVKRRELAEAAVCGDCLDDVFSGRD